ncbi:PREDICTED: basic 7S globulin-like [Lupinus angustifolius]|nr:PREDICTED: basic 7S globulin-like [Lupinus angustifolius]
MSPSTSIHFFLLLTTLLSLSCLSQSHKISQVNPITLPIAKDPKTNLFYTPIGIGTPQHNFNLTIDLGGPILWYDCNNNYNSSTYNPVHCDSKRCNGNAGCTGCNGPFKPGCSNDTCGANILNPFTDSIFSGDTGDDVLFVSGNTLSDLLSGCTNSDGFSGDEVLKGLPEESKGIIGFARTDLALQTQLSSTHKLPRKFSLCLPTSNNNGPGKVVIGGGTTQPTILVTTTLIVNPFSTAPIFSEGDPSYEYFIDVKSINIEGNDLNFKSSLLSIDSKGNGGTKISTMNPFTILHSSILKPLVRDFVKKASDRKIKKVASVAPFEACFDVSTIDMTVTGLNVPTIELVLKEVVQWTFYGGNSMVLVNKNVACLAFVDGGKEPRTSVIIGGYQLEDNLLEFDLVSSKLSFSSSLHRLKLTCSSGDLFSYPVYKA